MPPVFEAVEGELQRVTEYLNAMREPRDLYEVALVAHLLRASEIAEAVVHLAEHGHGEMALGAARIIFEAMVSGYWMSIDPEPRVQRYEHFAGRENHDMLVMLQGLRIPAPEGYGSVADHIEARKPYTREFRRLSRGWTGRTLDERVCDIAAHYEGDMPGAFYAFYRVASTLGNRMLHMGTNEAAQRLRDRALGPHNLTKVWSAYSLHLTAWAYGWLVYLVAKRMPLCDPAQWRGYLHKLMVLCEPVTSIRADSGPPSCC